MCLTHRRCDTSSTISVQSRKILGQIYPTRRMAVWSNLLSCEELIRFSVTVACSKSTVPNQGKHQGNLVVQDDTEEGGVNLQSAVVVNEAQLPELIQKETDAGPRGADHFGPYFLTDLRNDRLRLAFFPEVGQQRHAISLS